MGDTMSQRLTTPMVREDGRTNHDRSVAEMFTL